MKRMLISVDHDEWHAAIVDNGRLAQLEIEPVARDSCRGNICRAVVARVEPSLQSAFVDFGRDKQGFLPVGEIHPKLRGDNTDKRAPIQDILKAGTEILVQVVRDEIGNKGATLSTFISLPGRYLVLMPESDKTGVSRKLSDGARSRVKELTEKMTVPDGFGLIVRTSGETATKLELSKDLVYLNRLWAHINKRFDGGKGPETLYMERTLPIRFVRDYFTRDIEEIVIDDEATLQEVAAYLKLLMPRNLSAMESYSGAVPLFARYGIEGQVESVFSRQVALPSGGSIVIDQTEALVSIDVNSGRVKGKDIEDTARATNIEAAEEIGRQLVLRDLGGLVVVDFIDMRERKYVRAVEAAMKSAMKGDKARHKISAISEFGLLELSRQRLKSSVNKGVFEPCTHCSGTGFHRTSTAIASSVMRRIYEYIAQGEVRYVVAMLPPEAASYLLNNKRTELANVEREYHVSIEIIGVDGMTASDVMIERLENEPGQSSDRMTATRQRRISQKLDLVRNKLLQREETRLHRTELAKKSGALLDFGEIYAEVREATKGAELEEQAAEERKRRRQAQGQQGRQSGDAAAIAAAEAEVAAMAARPKGIFGWFKSLFAAPAAPQAQAEVIEVSQPAALEEQAAAAEADEARGHRSRRDDSRRGGGRGRGERAEGGRDEGDSRRGGRRRRGGRDAEESVASSRGNDAVDENDGERGERGGSRRRRRPTRGGVDQDDSRREEARGDSREARTRDGRSEGRSTESARSAPRPAAGEDNDAAAQTAGEGDASGEGAASEPRRRRRRRGGRGRSRNNEDNRVEGAPTSDAGEAAASAKRASAPSETKGNSVSDAAEPSEAPARTQQDAAPEADPAVQGQRAAQGETGAQVETSAQGETAAQADAIVPADAAGQEGEAAQASAAQATHGGGADAPPTPPPLPMLAAAPPPLPTAKSVADPAAGAETEISAAAGGDTETDSAQASVADEEQAEQDSKDPAVEMADAKALMRREIEKMRGAAPVEDDEGEDEVPTEAAADSESAEEVAAAAAGANRFVIDLRSDTSRSEGP